MSAATEVLQKAAAFTNATMHSRQVAELSAQAADVITDVLQSSEKTLTALEDEEAKIFKSLIVQYREEMQTLEKVGGVFKDSCRNVMDQWNQFDQFVKNLVSRNDVTLQKIEQCIQILQELQQRAHDCAVQFPVFQETVTRTIAVTVKLIDQCDAVSLEAERKSEATKVWYGVSLISAFIGIAASVVTGGTAAAVGGVLCSAGGCAVTAVTVSKYEDVAKKFKDHSNSLSAELDKLNGLYDDMVKVEGSLKIFIENIHFALQDYIQQAKDKQELEQLRKERDQHMNLKI